MILFAVWLGVVLILVIVALIFRAMAEQNKAEADRQRQRADDAEAVINNRRQLDTALETLHETHREETIDATNPTHLAVRDDFTNAWSGAERLHDAGTDPDHAASAATADSTGAAVHFVNRPDLR